MNETYKEIAIIGPTASGKTALSIEVAKKKNAIILSLDSLAVYKQIDIASAKPLEDEREGIKHFGIDEIYPNENFDVSTFIDLYKKAKAYAIENKKNLIIVGGTGFYLKALIDGISYMPPLTLGQENKLKKDLENISSVYEKMLALDPTYMENIESNDIYRIEKAYSLYLSSNLIPSEYFKKYPKEPIAPNLKVYEILWDKEILRDRISKRTQIMLDDGLIDEVIFLEKTYTREPSCMNSIGISETLDYLDSKITKKQLHEKISQNTARLAKSQRTFNKGQFKEIFSDELEQIRQKILTDF
jgi:tRNA dimethylallyltransferase